MDRHPMTSPFASPASLIKRWSCLLGWATALVLALSLAATLYNPAWTDEVFYVDPGACLALGRGFLSNGVSALGNGGTWGLSNPGVPVMLAGWFQVFGFGQFSAHTFFFVVQLAGALLLVRWVRNLHPLGTAGFLLAVALCMMLHSLAGNTIFHARHDAFALLLFAWFLGYAFPGEPVGKPWLRAFSHGIACVFFGLQFCGFFSLAAGGIFLWRRTRQAFVAGLGLAAGLIAGVLLLRYAYGEMGVWQSFLDNRGENFGRPFSLDKFYVSKEFLVLIPACLGLVLGEVLAGRGWRGEVAVAGWFGLMFLFGIPVIIQQIGLWQSPFSWMVMVPLLLMVMPACMNRPFGQGGWFVGVIAGLLLISCLVRLKELPAAVAETALRRQAVAEFRRLASPDEVTFGSMALFYELRASGQAVYWPYDRKLPVHPDLAKRVRWLVLSEVDRPIITRFLGGAWEQAYVSAGVGSAGSSGAYVILRRADPPSR